MFGAFGGSAECPELPSYRFYRMEQAASSHERPRRLIETITLSTRQCLELTLFDLVNGKKDIYFWAVLNPGWVG